MGLFDWLRKPNKKTVDNDKSPNVPVVTGVEGRGRGLPGFTDLPTKIYHKAYDIIYEHDCTFSPLYKRAGKCSKFSMHLVGSGALRDELQRVLDNTIGLPQILDFLSYSDVEGWRCAFMRVSPLGKMNVANFLGQGGRKIKAGGEYWWGGYEEPDVVRLRPTTQQIKKDEDASYDANRFIICSPSGDVNPEGDTRLGLNMVRIASTAAILDNAEYVYTERHSLPREIIETVIKRFNPSSVVSAMTSAITALRGADALDVAGTNAEQILKLLEPSGKTWQFLDALREKLESRAHKLVTGEDKSSGGGGGVDVGIPDNAEKQFTAAASRLLSLFAEEFSLKLIPFLIEANSHWLPAAEKDAPPMYIEFRPTPEKNKLSVAELCQVADRGFPIDWDDFFSITGLAYVPGVKEEFGSYYIKSKMNPNGKTEDFETTDSGKQQRKDRMKEGEPKDKTKDNDVRNLDEEDGSEDDDNA